MDSGNHWIILEENEVSENNATAGVYAGGGGVYVAINAIVKNNVIENNTCLNINYQVASGGGIAVDEWEVPVLAYISGNTVRYNSVTSDGSAGGAGIFVFSAKVGIFGNTIGDNLVDAGYSYGGGLHMQWQIQLLS